MLAVCLFLLLKKKSYFLYEVCNFHRVLVYLTCVEKLRSDEKLESAPVFTAFYICSGEFLTNYFVCCSLNDRCLTGIKNESVVDCILFLCLQ